MLFGLCNAPSFLHHCIMATLSNFIEDIMEVFVDDFSMNETTFDHFLHNLSKVLQRCEDTNLALN